MYPNSDAIYMARKKSRDRSKTVELRLLTSDSWPSSCLSLPSAKITRMYYFAWHWVDVF